MVITLLITLVDKVKEEENPGRLKPRPDSSTSSSNPRFNPYLTETPRYQAPIQPQETEFEKAKQGDVFDINSESELKRKSDRMKEERKDMNKDAPTPAASDIAKGLWNDLTQEIPKNIYARTIGKVGGYIQNRHVLKELKKDPNRRLMHAVPGTAQEASNMTKLSKKAEREYGLLTYVHPSYSRFSPGKKADKFFNRVDKIHKKTGVDKQNEATRFDVYGPNGKKISSRNDWYHGHSDGGILGEAIASDPRILEYGIKRIHSHSAPEPGMGFKNLSQKLIKYIIRKDNHPDSPEKMKQDTNRHYLEPLVDVVYSSSSSDTIVPPEQASSGKSPKKGPHYVFHDPKMTHFSGAGANEPSNDLTLKLIHGQGPFEGAFKHHSKKYHTQHQQEYKEAA